MDDATKEKILDRIYEKAGQCAICHSPYCGHVGNEELPDTLSTDDVLWAINLGEYFYPEKQTK